MTFTIAPASIADWTDIYALARKEFPYLAPSKTRFTARYTHPKHIILSAENKGRFAGFIEAEILGPFIARINGVAVKPEFRGKGCATHLMSRMLDALAGLHISEIQLLVKQQNAIAKFLYTKFGFKYAEKLDREIDHAKVDMYRLKLPAPAAPSYVR